jgi:two-component system response regulator VicR
MKERRTILIADDDAQLRAAVRSRLRAVGLQVIEAESGVEVLREYLGQPVDAILLDQEMPGGDGKTIAQFIRQESDIPIIFLSGHPREEFRGVVHQLPDVYFLPKPFDSPKLVELLNSLWCN